MPIDYGKRQFVLGSLAATLCVSLPTTVWGSEPLLYKKIPSTSESISAIGMGSWITFNIGRDEYLQEQRTEVLSKFFAMGGQLVDTSPMYGSSEQVIGQALRRLNNDSELFCANKVWSRSADKGRYQFNTSRQLWGKKQLDLVQVHNLLGCQQQMAMLKELKQDKLIRYLGVTTSHGRRHQEMEKIIQQGEVDFVQLTYNILDSEAEQRLIPMAADNGIAVIVNRPFQGGHLFRYVKGRALPPWAKELGCNNWAQYFLRFIISHPQVTCAIPATSRLDHMTQNMNALSKLHLPNKNQQKLMSDFFRNSL